MGRASPFHVTYGDYRTEDFIEAAPTPPLYQLQNSLPRLPVPTLQETFKRYLASVEPLAESPEEYESHVASARDFLRPGGLVSAIVLWIGNQCPEVRLALWFCPQVFWIQATAAVFGWDSMMGRLFLAEEVLQ